MTRDELRIDLENFDNLFATWKQKNPDRKFSQYSATRIVSALKKGRPHTTLGPKLTTNKDWWQDGVAHYKLILSKVDTFDESKKICDYGCGSLRVGAHFIKRQNAGCFFGLDVAEYFFEEGVRMMGDEIVAKKKPVLKLIDKGLDETIAASVDAVFSFNVACHIHPDEQDDYNANLKSICHKPGSRLLLHTMNYHTPVRFQRSGWAYPVEQYIKWMRPLNLLEVTVAARSVEKNGYSLASYLLLFERVDEASP